MDRNQFLKSLEDDSPPLLSTHLAALWYDAKADWARSHNLIQDVDDANGAWIHAYLHRKEGDDGNAGYWYNRAGKKFPVLSLQEEWQQILDAMIQK